MDMMSLIDTFFKTDDLKALIHQAGHMLNCPMIAIDDAFQIQASYSPENFQDDVFLRRCTGERLPTKQFWQSVKMSRSHRENRCGCSCRIHRIHAVLQR